MKILKPILYCLLWAILAFLVMYFIKNDNCELKSECYNTVIKDKEVSIWELFFTTEQLEIYNQISLLINSIGNIWSNTNSDLIRLLDKLRNNLNCERKIKSLIIAINKKVKDGWINIESKQQNKLDSILDKLSKGIDTVNIWIDDYEKNKLEILVLLPTMNWDNIRADIEWKFNNFEDNVYISSSEEKTEALDWIWNTIVTEYKKNKREWENDFNLYFCNIFDYFDLNNKKCNRC